MVDGVLRQDVVFLLMGVLRQDVVFPLNGVLSSRVLKSVLLLLFFPQRKLAHTFSKLAIIRLLLNYSL